ncbi:MAG: proton-conducting transporter membrane subunit [Pseudomonadota bacterium]
METIILFAPLLGALLAGLTWRVITDAGAQWAATGLMIFAALLSWVLWANFDGDMRQVYLLDWVRSGTLDAALAVRLDATSALMMVIVNSISALAHLYAIGFMERDKAFDEGLSFRPRFFAYLSLFTFAMLLLVTADNMLQLVLGLNVSAAMVYLLIAFRHHYKSANAAAIKSVVVMGLGNVGLFLGAAGIFILTDSLAFDDIFETVLDGTSAPLFAGLSLIEVSATLVLVSAMAASAQIVLHSWLPDAMETPTPASALIAGIFVMSGAFVIWRLSPLFAIAPGASGLTVGVGAATALLAALFACTQTDVKRAMAYFASAQMGFVFVSLGLDLGQDTGDIVGMQLPLFAVVQVMLALCLGAVMRAMDDNRDLRTFGGLRQKLPAVALLMVLVALVATGFGVSQAALGMIAPATGQRLYDTAFASQPVLFWILCLAAGFGVFAIWRIVFLSVFGASRARQDVFDAVGKTPLIMVVAVTVMGVMLLSFVVWKVNAFAALPGSSAPGWMSVAPLIATGLSFLVAVWFYLLQPGLPKTLKASLSGLHLALQNGFYFDALCNRVLTAPLRTLGEAFSETGDGRVFSAPFSALSTRLVVTYTDIIDRRFGGVLLSAGALVFFGLLAVISWTVISWDPA